MAMTPVEWVVQPFVDSVTMQRALGAGTFAAIACGLVGTWVVLRGMTFIGDALAHGVLPGLAIATIVGFSPTIGAFLSAGVMIGGISVVGRRARLQEDAAIGLLFVGMLALGVLIISRSRSFAGELTGFLFGGITSVTTADLVLAAVVAAVVLAVVVVGYRAFLALTFNREAAALMGMRPTWAHAVLMVLVTATIVASFTTVGTLLVFALITAPAAAAGAARASGGLGARHLGGVRRGGRRGRPAAVVACTPGGRCRHGRVRGRHLPAGTGRVGAPAAARTPDGRRPGPVNDGPVNDGPVSGSRWPVGLPTRLRPVHPIGVGGSAVVWRARDTDLGVDVAVKILRRADPTGARTSRLEQEVRALARLGDVPGICRLHEVGCTATGTGWVVLDLAEGGTLVDRAPLPEDELVRVAVVVARALAAAHVLEVCHGDVTPTNIVFDAVGAPLLADFAMSDLGGAGDPDGGLTPAFAAPERLRGASPRPESDVFGLGASLRAVAVPPEVRRQAVGLRSGAAAGWLARCVLEDPTQRPSASELAEGLSALGAH
jgi:zinc/manganese transport system permease protein